MQKKLMLTIDDFGLYPLVDADVIQWLNPRKISRCSVMMGLGPVEFLKEWKKAGVALDIHLNSTVSRPIMKREEKFVQVKNLPRRLVFLKRILAGELPPQEIKGVWTAQIEEFVRVFNFFPDGLNSHEHIHFFPPYFKTAVELAQKYHIPFIRLGEKSIPPRSLEYRTWILSTFHKQDYRIFKESRLSTSAALYSYDWSWDSFNLTKIEEKFPHGTEVIFHPSQKNDYEALKILHSLE